jgi:hypothetical protein
VILADQLVKSMRPKGQVVAVIWPLFGLNDPFR